MFFRTLEYLEEPTSGVADNFPGAVRGVPLLGYLFT